MQHSKHIVIIAGEESGDLHAAALIKELKATHPNLKITGIGGQHMQKAGAELISDLARFGVTGLTEVVKHFNVIRKAFKTIKQHLKEQKPDLLILVDYPGFNLRLAHFVKKKLGIKILYYISPQIWAWKAKRIHLIKECVDTMAVILPFEKKIYEDAEVPVHFVGHPLISKIEAVSDSTSQRTLLKVPLDAKIIALLPGSRTHEIERHMPVLRDTAEQLHQRYPKIEFLIPIAGTINTEKVKQYFSKSTVPVTFIEAKALNCMAAADFVIVASGTASLESALLKKPMCIIYKASFLTYFLGTKLIKVPYIGLCNLLSNKMIVPEFIQHQCTAINLTNYISSFFEDSKQSEQMIEALDTLRASLSSKKSDCSLASLIEDQLSLKKAIF